MKYTTDEALARVRERSREIQKKRDQKVLGGMTCLVVVLLGVLAAAISAFERQGAAQAAAGSRDTIYGAFMLSSGTGGYILVAVIAFIIGVLFAVLIIRYRKLSSHDSQSVSDSGNSPGTENEQKTEGPGL